MDSKTKIYLLGDFKIKVHLLKDFKTNVLLLHLLALLHVDSLSHANFKARLHHHKFNLANSHFPVDFKTKVLHNLDFKIKHL